MNSRLLRIMAVGLTTLFLSAQAFACGGAGKDKDVSGKTDRDTATMCDRSGSDQSTDRDIGNMDKGSKDTSKSKDMDQSQINPFDMYFPMP